MGQLLAGYNQPPRCVGVIEALAAANAALRRADFEKAGR
jgi:hypothetical protein